MSKPIQCTPKQDTVKQVCSMKGHGWNCYLKWAISIGDPFDITTLLLTRHILNQLGPSPFQDLEILLTSSECACGKSFIVRKPEVQSKIL